MPQAEDRVQGMKLKKDLFDSMKIYQYIKKRLINLLLILNLVSGSLTFRLVGATGLKPGWNLGRDYLS